MNGNELATMPAAGASVSQGFGSTEMTVAAETAATALAAQARAAVEARCILALRRPRNWDQVRQLLLRECARPGFAAVARYAKPVGGQRIVGPSIRFAEAAMRCMGNLVAETQVVLDDPTKRCVRISLTDLENNLTLPKDIVLEKTVERRQPKPGQEIIGQRTNSQGQPVFIVRATEDDLLNKEAALSSKALRGLVLRLLPGDLLDEAMEAVTKTLRSNDAADPNAARKRLADAFAKLGIQPVDLAAYLGHGLEAMSPAELEEMRAIYAAIAEGETNWREVMSQRAGESAEGEPSQSKSDGLKQRLRKPRAEAKPAACATCGAPDGRHTNGCPAAPPADEPKPEPQGGTDAPTSA